MTVRSGLALWMLLGWLVMTGAAQTPRAASPYAPTAEHPSPAWFVDVAAKAGISVRNVNGSAESKQYLIESTGSGVAILDYDRDGWPDIFLVNGESLEQGQAVSGGKTAGVRPGEPVSHLFHNNHDGTFTDVTERAGLGVSTPRRVWS